MWLRVVEAVILNWSSDKGKWDIFLKHSWSLWEKPVFLPRGAEFRKSCTRTAPQRPTRRCCFSGAGAIRQRPTCKGVITLKWIYIHSVPKIITLNVSPRGAKVWITAPFAEYLNITRVHLGTADSGCKCTTWTPVHLNQDVIWEDAENTFNSQFNSDINTAASL